MLSNGRKLRLAATFLGLAAILEAGTASVYVAKRVANNQPFADLSAHYTVLQPFWRLLRDQWVFPPSLADNFVGDYTTPGGAAIRLYYRADPLLGHRLAPNALITNASYDWRATGPQGFPVTEVPASKYVMNPPADVFRVVVLGGSTVEGYGATSSLEALPAQLLRLLAQEYRPSSETRTRFEVMNAGVGGYFSPQELLFYLSEIGEFRPHLVISYGGWNDSTYGVRMAEGGGNRLDLPHLDCLHLVVREQC